MKGNDGDDWEISGQTYGDSESETEQFMLWSIEKKKHKESKLRWTEMVYGAAEAEDRGCIQRSEMYISYEKNKSRNPQDELT